MLVESKFEIPPENHQSFESEHIENIQSSKPRFLKEIRETENCLKSCKSKFDDSDIFSLDSNIPIRFSSEIMLPSDNADDLVQKEKCLRNRNDSNKSIEQTHKKKRKKDHLENFNYAFKKTFKNLEPKSADKLSKGYKRNFQCKTDIEEKEEKKKMHNFSFLLSTLILVKSFVEKLRNLSFLRSSSKLRKPQFSLIGDKTYIKEDFQNFLDRNRIQKFDEKYLILDPSKKYSIFFDFLVLLALSYYFLMIPLHFTYEAVAFNDLKMHLDAIAFYMLVFDIFRTFNTAFYLKGGLVFSRWRIAVEYSRKKLLFDFVSLTPTFILIMKLYQKDFDYFLILFYLKIKNFKEIITRLEQLLLTNKKFNHGFSLLKLIFWIIFTTHLFACVWNGIGIIGEEYFEKTWLKEKSLDHSHFLDQYLFSYYFVCVTMNTVGFGDISPTNKLEVCFCIVFIFLACGIFAYSINSIGLILTDISKQQDEYRKDLNTINDFMRKKNISFDLRIRIRKYLEYIKKENKIQEDKQTSKTIEKLSDSLREELFLEANGSILKRIKFFSWYFSEETLRKTMMIMKEKRFTPGDIIFEKGDFQESKLYIIKAGEVELLFGNSSHLNTVHTCKKGETFGVWSFFSGQEQNLSARSLDFTTAFAIDRTEFLSIIYKVNKDFEKFNEIKANLVLYNDPSPLHLSCFCCHKDNHRVEKCPIIHYCPNKQIVIDKFLFHYFQERSDYKRKRKKSNSFAARSNNSTTIKLLQDDLRQSDSYHECEKESEKGDDEKEKASDAMDLLASSDKIKPLESSESENIKSEINYSLKISTKLKELLREETYNLNVENTRTNLSDSATIKVRNNQIKFFDIFHFDKLGFFSNYFPNNDVEPILKKIELRRVNFLKRKYARKSVSIFNFKRTSQNFVKIHNIDEAFIQDGNIKINQKAMFNFNEKKRKGFLRTITRQLNLKKKFFKRIEESPEEIKNYFRAMLKKKEHFLKKKLKKAWEKIRLCLKNVF